MAERNVICLENPSKRRRRRPRKRPSDSMGLLLIAAATVLSLGGTIPAASAQAQSVVAVAPPGTSVRSLGQLYDANFQPLRGRMTFESPEQIAESRTYREVSREASTLQVRASARVWGAGGQASANTGSTYGYIRAISLERVVQIPPTEELQSAAPGAAYFVSKIYMGRMFEMRVTGSRSAVAARISYLTASAEMTASAQSATAQGYTIGLAPRGGDMVAAMSADSAEQIAARFEATGPAAAVLLEYERVPATSSAAPVAQVEATPGALGGQREASGVYVISVVSLEFPRRKPNNWPWDGTGGPDMRAVFSQGRRIIRTVNAPRNQLSARFSQADLGGPITISAQNPLRIDFWDVDLASDDSAGHVIVRALHDGDNSLTSETGTHIVLRVVRQQ